MKSEPFKPSSVTFLKMLSYGTYNKEIAEHLKKS